jgi:hypothetical protein
VTLFGSAAPVEMGGQLRGQVRARDVTDDESARGIERPPGQMASIARRDRKRSRDTDANSDGDSALSGLTSSADMLVKAAQEQTTLLSRKD